MITEGFFTENEVSDAQELGAIVQEAKGGRIKLDFSTTDACEKWVRQQQELHPTKWADSVRISAKST
mgnify:FL=1